MRERERERERKLSLINNVPHVGKMEIGIYTDVVGNELIY